MEVPIRQVAPDQAQVSGYGQVLHNVVVTETGTRLRPGSLELVDIGEGSKVNGIYDWDAQNTVVVTSGNKVFTMDDSVASFFSDLLLETGDSLVLEDGAGTLLLEATATAVDVTGDSINASNPVIFADYGNYLYMAAGGAILELHTTQSQVSHGGKDYTCIKNNIAVEPGVTAGWATYWQDDGAGSTYTAWSASTRYGSGTADALEDAGWPSLVKFIAILDGYLFALEEDTQIIYQSKVEEPWNQNGFFSAEQLPEDANCMWVYSGDLWVGGKASIQTFTNDGVTDTFIASNYGAITSGVLSPYSFRDVSGAFYFIDEYRRLVKMTGREPQSLSVSLNSHLQSLPTVTDAVGREATIDGITYYILSFPSSRQTVAVNLSDSSWSVWYYDTGVDYKEWQGHSVTYVPRWDLIIAGDDAGGVNQIKTNYPTDDGTSLVGVVRSTRMQTQERVRVSRVEVALTKVIDADETSASFTVRWRDDDGDWVTPRTYTIADNTNTDVVARIRRLGTYRSNRQYEFDVSNLHPYAIQRVEQI